MPGRPLLWGSLCGKNTTLSNLNSTHPLYHFISTRCAGDAVFNQHSDDTMTVSERPALRSEVITHRDNVWVGWNSLCLSNRQHIVVYWPSGGEWGGTSQHIVPPLVKQEGTSQQNAIFWEERDEAQSLTLTCWLDQSGCNPTATALTMLFTAINSSQRIQSNTQSLV